MNNSQKPVARQDGLVIQEMSDEILVFDLETNQAHCLNQTAAFVWKVCDGENSVSEIINLLGENSGKSVPEDLVWLAIDQLSETGLLKKQLSADFKNQTRREIIKKVGLAAVIALPLISSLVAPTAALAVACSGTNGAACGGNVCCGGQCCTNIMFPAGCPGNAPQNNPCGLNRGPVRSSGIKPDGK